MSSPLNQWSQVNDHLNNIVEYITSLTPKQVSVETYGGRFSAEDLVHQSTKAPAIKVSLLRLRVSSAHKKIAINSLPKNNIVKPKVGDSEVVFDMTIAITVLAKDEKRELPRYEAAVNLVQFLSMVLPHQTFNSENVTAVKADVDFRNLFSASVDKNKKIAFWGGAFNQVLTVPIPDEVSTVPVELFWSESNDGSESDYQPLENATDA